MAGDSSFKQDGYDSNDLEVVENDPTGRYCRYKEVVGKGAFKTMYRAFDVLTGTEVAWNQVKITDVFRDSKDLERLHYEFELLKTLDHKNMVKFHNAWIDTRHNNINFITDIVSFTSLRQYTEIHRHVNLKDLKNWSRQILQCLVYLHSHYPTVIHRDLTGTTIFINKNNMEVKIGDLGLATILQTTSSSHSVIGTPEFMAPELYGKEYNELVDIYAFGMCLLELVTFEYPYYECCNAAQIYKKVMSGTKPASLDKVQNREVREFIEKCIVEVSGRLSAEELLEDPFLQSEGDNDEIFESSHEDDEVQSQLKDNNMIFLKLCIGDSKNHVRNIHVPFDMVEDTSLGVASELITELELEDQNVATIAKMIDLEILAHITNGSGAKL